jgi:dienelactone hydrolase
LACPDIFGYFDQTIQGADILASSDPERKYRVFIPDFFEGDPADIAWYPHKTEEDKQKFNAFFVNQAAFDKNLQRIPGLVQAANETAEGGNGFGSWAIVGYCWGGKITTLQGSCAVSPRHVGCERCRESHHPHGAACVERRARRRRQGV